MSRTVLALFIWIVLAPAGFGQGVKEYDWDAADRNIARLVPSTFTELPPRIVHYLNDRGCTVPQTNSGDSNNVIRGRFANPHQTDWAVLCSVDRRSTILVFWNGSVEGVAEIAESADRDRLQGGENRTIVYSRLISPADKNYIERHYQLFRDSGAPKPPPIDHEGINDAFLEKASAVHYFYEGKWLQLAGAD